MTTSGVRRRGGWFLLRNSMEQLCARGCGIEPCLTVPRVGANVEFVRFEGDRLFLPQLVTRVVHDEVKSLKNGRDGHVSFLDCEGPAL